ncbi:hypothetical protein [Acuticoccus sp. I52.16.1]|uniref:hypothetical protein n=1 Tax=Acuticoccus sp. I52.16.1 TaxID=2928472 RepID=UPI001FD0D4B9|nr:hypothetical protein [Acuticoccus sp. I52.16.1]UOM34615.1 hypothetical protein MRB58_22855 [Acuticoccus sp. I52.16.1]
MMDDPRDSAKPKTEDDAPGHDEATCDFDDDELDEALDESFPASDPLPPPTRAGD